MNRLPAVSSACAPRPYWRLLLPWTHSKRVRLFPGRSSAQRGFRIHRRSGRQVTSVVSWRSLADRCGAFFFGRDFVVVFFVRLTRLQLTTRPCFLKTRDGVFVVPRFWNRFGFCVFLLVTTSIWCGFRNCLLLQSTSTASSARPVCVPRCRTSRSPSPSTVTTLSTSASSGELTMLCFVCFVLCLFSCPRASYMVMSLMSDGGY